MNVFLEVVRMISYDFIYLIKVCEDVFNVFTHIHSVAVPQSANLESPTARWWQRKGRAGSFQGAQRVGLFQTCPAWSSTMFHPEMIMFWSFQWWFYIVLHGFFMGFDPWGIQNFSKPKPSSHGTWRGVASWASQGPGWISQSAGPRVASKTCRWKFHFWWSKSWYSWYNDTIWYLWYLFTKISWSIVI